MPDMGRCDTEIYEHGEAVAMIADRPADKIEEFVIGLRKKTKQRIDWHYVAGRGIIKVIGDSNKVRKAIKPNVNGFLILMQPAAPRPDALANYKPPSMLKIYLDLYADCPLDNYPKQFAKGARKEYDELIQERDMQAADLAQLRAQPKRKWISRNKSLSQACARRQDGRARRSDELLSLFWNSI